jgi:hypothetical protein
MAQDIIRAVLAASVLNGGTFTVGYPVGRDNGDYAGGWDHQVVSNTYGPLSAIRGEVAFSFGASNVTITNNSGGTLLAGTEIYVQLDRAGANGTMDIDLLALANPGKMAGLEPFMINLGAPVAASANAICASQALNTGANGLLNGATAGILDKPRNVVAAWTNTAVLTVTGVDEYGNVVAENSASGTTFTGAKAFARVTRVQVSANVTGLTVGTGVVLGLPVFLPQVGRVIREMVDGAVPGTGATIVAGVQAAATATTGDVRGTYNPNSAPDGARDYQVIAMLEDPTYIGRRQFAG